jgi:hypothetical protein
MTLGSLNVGVIMVTVGSHRTFLPGWLWGLRINFQAGCWWLTPVILAIQEAEIRRITVQIQPGRIVQQTLSLKKITKKGLVGVTQGVDPEFKPQYHKKEKRKYPTQCRAGGVAQVLGSTCLASELKPQSHQKSSSAQDSGKRDFSHQPREGVSWVRMAFPDHVAFPPS